MLKLIIRLAVSLIFLLLFASHARVNEPKRDIQLTSDKYLGHTWQVDENHLIWWDGKPYVPFGGFGIRPGNEFGLNTYNLWIDFDPFIENPKYTRQQHKRDIARRLKEIQQSGGTCIVQFSMALPHIPEGPTPGMHWREPEGGIDASRLADPQIKRAIFKVWEDYAPAVRNECVRAIVLWNEINTWHWPEELSVERYGELLSQYAEQVKRLVGNLPVCFKTAGAWNASSVVAGATSEYADGLGFDMWFKDPQDLYARNEMLRILSMIQKRQRWTTWFFIAEGGRTLGEDNDETSREDYWAGWPPFRSKDEAWGILSSYAELGAKGFIYNGPDSRLGSKYRDSYRWLGELKDKTIRLMISTKRPKTFQRVLQNGD